jgi:predicted nucleotidyltransferase
MRDLSSLLPPPHREFLDRALPLLAQDARILGIAGAGSMLTGGMDAYSDLDLVIVSDAAAHPALMQERFAIAGRLGQLLTAFTGEHVGEPRVLICLYDAPLLHVDLKFVALEALEHRIEDPVVLFERDGCLSAAMRASVARHPMPEPQWIEDRFWVWVHYAALRLGRGELFEVIDFLAFLRGTVFGPIALVKAGKLPRGVRRLERDAPEAAAALRDTLARHEAASCAAVIEAAIAHYRELRQHPSWAHVARKTEAEAAAVEYFRTVARGLRPA